MPSSFPPPIIAAAGEEGERRSKWKKIPNPSSSSFPPFFPVPVPIHCLSTSFTHTSSGSLFSIKEATWIVDAISDKRACKAGQCNEEEEVEGGREEEE